MKPTGVEQGCTGVGLLASTGVSKLVSWCFEPSQPQRITSRLEHKLHSISKLFISQVIILQVMSFEPIYIPRALNTGTCIQQGDLFYSAGLPWNHVLATANTGKIGRGFGKMQMNGPGG